MSGLFKVFAARPVIVCNSCVDEEGFTFHERRKLEEKEQYDYNNDRPANCAYCGRDEEDLNVAEH